MKTAYCSSRKCDPVGRSTRGVVKFESEKITTLDCPDCKYALLWTESKGYLNQVIGQRRKKNPREGITHRHERY